MKKIIFFIAVFLTTQIAFADDKSILPSHYVKDNFVFNRDALVLNNKAVNVPQVFLFQNISSKNINLNHSVAQPSASAGWDSTLKANQWSAIMVDKKSFVMTCSQSDVGKLQKLSCQKVVRVCELEEAKVDPTLNGTFWLAENQSLADLLKALEKRGVGLD